ncbi:uncharacterized protein LOC122645027 [Telopea speciosissima]|uniref:uncharacterized protein LOC122645027 n=1 Tax=Telopea speciosissima TaxID=54955 RepID=UPI001CC396A4|nr:uncharacterized protein LOC122645027 [Telopea speciosissima]
MAIRLSTVLHKLVSAEQGAFQKGKVIFDNIGVASELANMMSTKCRGGGSGMKLDIQKAFDTLEWDYLFDVLGAFDLKSVKRIKRFLDDYGSYLGQVINLSKSKVFLGRVIGHRRQRLIKELQIPTCVLPTRYLGVQLVKGRVKNDVILPLVDQFKKRLASWKGRLLSMAGRVELVQSIMGSMPIHNFSVYLWLKAIIETIERWTRNFIWSGEADRVKAIIVRWDSLCKPKKEKVWESDI